MAEVELGRLAEQKAANAKVKEFGARMAADHGKANGELKALAARANVTLPSTVGDQHQATRDRLAKLSGAAFDRAYIKEMVSDHEKDVAAFRKESESGQDAAVKAFAAKTLPTLDEHLKLVQAIDQALGQGAVGTAGSSDAPHPTTPR
jgi:putative membrane protein